MGRRLEHCLSVRLANRADALHRPVRRLVQWRERRLRHSEAGRCRAATLGGRPLRVRSTASAAAAATTASAAATHIAVAATAGSLATATAATAATATAITHRPPHALRLVMYMGRPRVHRQVTLGRGRMRGRRMP